MRRSPSLIALPHNRPTSSQRGVGVTPVLRHLKPDGGGESERRRPRTPPSSAAPARRTRRGLGVADSDSAALCAPPRPRRGLEKNSGALKFQLNTSPKAAPLSASWPACNVAAPGTPSDPRVANSSFSLQAEAVLHALQSPALLSVGWGEPPSCRAQEPQPNPFQRSPSSLTPRPAAGRGAGPAAEPPPTASRARRAGGWRLGRLHLLFLKRRGADERHHWSPGPGHCHARRRALRSNSSSSGGGGQSGGQAPKVDWVPGASRPDRPPRPRAARPRPVTQLVCVLPGPGRKAWGGPPTYPRRRSQSRGRGAAAAEAAREPLSPSWPTPQVAVQVPGMQVRTPGPPPAVRDCPGARGAHAGRRRREGGRGFPDRSQARRSARWPGRRALGVSRRVS